MTEEEVRQKMQEGCAKISPKVASMTAIIMDAYKEGFNTCWELLTGRSFQKEDEQQIKAEVERRIATHKLNVGCSFGYAQERIEELEELLSFIDSLQVPEEPSIQDIVDKHFWEMLGEEPVSEELEEASKEWLRSQLDKSYANYGEAKMMELTRFDGYDMLDAIEFGINLQKQKMLKILLSL